MQRLVDDEAMIPAAAFSPSLGTWGDVEASESSQAQGPAADGQGPPAPGSEEASAAIPEPPSPHGSCSR